MSELGYLLLLLKQLKSIMILKSNQNQVGMGRVYSILCFQVIIYHGGSQAELKTGRNLEVWLDKGHGGSLLTGILSWPTQPVFFLF